MFQLPFLDQFRNVVSYSQIDDFVDVLSCFATPSIFLFGAILISARTYVGSPIQCWIHQTYSGSWEEYAETYCFLKNTYFIPHSESVAGQLTEDKNSVRYYQWSSMYLAVCALSFILPKLFWKYTQTTADIPLTYFCDTANEIRKETTDTRKPKIEEMSKYLTEKLQHIKDNGASYLTMTIAYFVTKGLYIFIAVFQFVLLAHFLNQSSDWLWGYHLLLNLITGKSWEQTGLFPRVTYCTFPIRQADGLAMQNHTTQCVLGVNEFNEKIFLFIWYWLVFIIVFTAFATLRAIVRLHNNRIVSKLIKMRALLDKPAIAKFSDEYLKSDGRMILSYVKMESDIVAQELAETLFQHYIDEEVPKNATQQVLAEVPPLEKDKLEDIKCVA